MKSLKEIRQKANELFKDSIVTYSHLLKTWFEFDTLPNPSVYLENSGLDEKTFLSILDKYLIVQNSNEEKEDIKLLTSATIESKDHETSGIHLLKVLVSNPDHRITGKLIEAGLNPLKVIENINNNKPQLSFMQAAGVEPKKNLSGLSKFGRNLTDLVKNGEFDELAMREHEYTMLTNVLLRRHKGNAILTGAAGVGKTALVELFAKEAALNAESPFHDYTIYEISIAKLVSNTTFRGQFEANIELVMAEAINCKNCILFMDEIHLLFGAGSTMGSDMDAANLLKPYIARDKIKIIGATTASEYQQYFTKDDALARRFQEVKIAEPDKETLVGIIKQQLNILEEHHKLSFPLNLLDTSIELSSQYITDRNQPDKTVDLLDNAMVIARKGKSNKVTPEDLYTAISNMTGLSVRILNGKNSKAFASLAENLKKSIVGQDAAINLVVSSVTTRQFDLSDGNRPLGVFLFVGDTGVGKSELAKQLAEVYFQNSRKLVRFDLAEYSDNTSVNKLIGSAPGYIGSNREGRLMRALQETPSCLLLFDEIEKAHPDVINLLLGLLENGRISNNYGKEYDAKQCIIILTSNAVTSDELNPKSIGFNPDSTKPNIQDLLSKKFPIELLGRLDAIVPFNPLNNDNYREIIELNLEKLKTRLKKKSILISYSQKSVSKILDILKDNKTGVRGLQAVLEQNIIHPITTILMKVESEKELNINIDDFL